jgi:hypothetical protein
MSPDENYPRTLDGTRPDPRGPRPLEDRLDVAWRLTPDLIRAGPEGRQWPVDRVDVFPPREHPARCPIGEELYAVRLTTCAGVRWFGFGSAHGVSLCRAAVAGFPARFEEVAAWHRAPL